MGTRVHYPEEVKRQVVMKQAGVTNKEILEQLGIKDKKQIKTWMKWYRNGETHRTYIRSTIPTIITAIITASTVKSIFLTSKG
ncbi:transposase [Brevibacterium sp. JNUCC-42]|nr:transposase [Brevibacterium sp. JNUCC-42]QOS98083.1 transposase [Brevibacterium sp. JNUCC-42]